MTEQPPMPMPKKVTWADDPQQVRAVVDDVGQVLGLLPATRDLGVQMVLLRDRSEPPELQDSEAVAAVEDVASALERHGLRLELMGLTQADLRQMLADGMNGQTTSVRQGAFAKPTDEDRRAILALLGQLNAKTRQRLFKTSNMLVIGGIVRTALYAMGKQADEQAADASTSGRRKPPESDASTPAGAAAVATTTTSLIETSKRPGGTARVIAWVVGGLVAIGAVIWALTTFLPGVLG